MLGCLVRTRVPLRLRWRFCGCLCFCWFSRFPFPFCVVSRRVVCVSCRLPYPPLSFPSPFVFAFKFEFEVYPTLSPVRLRLRFHSRLRSDVATFVGSPSSLFVFRVCVVRVYVDGSIRV